MLREKCQKFATKIKNSLILLYIVAFACLFSFLASFFILLNKEGANERVFANCITKCEHLYKQKCNDVAQDSANFAHTQTPLKVK